ncbi:MAG TPA: hemerythrin domain-containing protein, partial [Paludibacter sp.]|nr:hemerythrin domain-containing protein [Paludibacter sp.]
IADNIESKNVFYTSDIEDIIVFLDFFVDKSHHSKEEIFYQELSLQEQARENVPVSVMLYEHVLTRKYMNDIKSCIENCKVGNNFSVELLAESLINYIRLINNHISKEENIIFPLAEQVFSDEQQKKISKQFEKIEENAEVHEFKKHYQELLRKLKRNYSD